MKRDWKREQPLAPDSGVLGERAGSTTSILGRLVREEEREQLMVAAGWCREKDQAVIFRHLFEDRSYEEIAEDWGVTRDVTAILAGGPPRRRGPAITGLMARHGILCSGRRPSAFIDVRVSAPIRSGPAWNCRPGSSPSGSTRPGP